MIPFNVPVVTPNVSKNMAEALACPESLQGGGKFSRECIEQITKLSPTSKVYLTPSCTSALELAARLIKVKAGDEVIVPSYTYVSTANAFASMGATIVYMDIDPKTMNMDVSLVEQAMSAKTVAIVPVHYGGSSCDMDLLLTIAEQRGVFVIEDAAQAYSATYKSRALGTIGHIGCFSFHATKNYTAGGQGGAIMVNDPSMHARADIVQQRGILELPHIPVYAAHNSHIFWLKWNGEVSRRSFIDFMGKAGISVVFHYVPLHSTPIGRATGRFSGPDIFTTREASRLVRLPLYHTLSGKEQDEVISRILAFAETLVHRLSLSCL